MALDPMPVKSSIPEGTVTRFTDGRRRVMRDGIWHPTDLPVTPPPPDPHTAALHDLARAIREAGQAVAEAMRAGHGAREERE